MILNEFLPNLSIIRMDPAMVSIQSWHHKDEFDIETIVLTIPTKSIY